MTPDLSTIGLDADLEAELVRLAEAGDPDAPLPDDAVPFVDPSAPVSDLLPTWYMPAPAGAPPLRGWRRGVAWLIIVGFLAVVASGLCNTYGILEIA